MVHDKRKSDQNYLTGSIPSEVTKLPSFDPYYVGEFMLMTFLGVKKLCSLFNNNTHTSIDI
jgi:hypothetical protein